MSFAPSSFKIQELWRLESIVTTSAEMSGEAQRRYGRNWKPHGTSETAEGSARASSCVFEEQCMLHDPMTGCLWIEATPEWCDLNCDCDLCYMRMYSGPMLIFYISMIWYDIWYSYAMVCYFNAMLEDACLKMIWYGMLSYGMPCYAKLWDLSKRSFFHSRVPFFLSLIYRFFSIKTQL